MIKNIEKDISAISKIDVLTLKICTLQWVLNE